MGREHPDNITVIATNKKAKFEYHFHAEFEAGIILRGTEIKSIRKGMVNLNDAYCYFQDGELYIQSMYIGEYSHGTYNNHETRRIRKLLLRKNELKKLSRKVREKGFTITPYQIYITERGLAKILIALTSGKKSFDKRNSIKEKDTKRQMDRVKKERF